MKRHALLALLLVVVGVVSTAPTAYAQGRLGPVFLTSTTCPGNGCLTFGVGGRGSIAVQARGSGTWEAAVQGSLDGVNFETLSISAVDGSGTVSSFTSTGLWVANVAGLEAVRVILTSYTSGTAIVYVQSVTGGGGGSTPKCFGGLMGVGCEPLEYTDADLAFAGLHHRRTDPRLGYRKTATGIVRYQASLCVKTGGSDATANGSINYVAGNEAGSTCWQTIGRALWGNASRSSPNTANAVDAGETVYVFGGSYDSAVTLGIDEFEGLYRAVNTGTLGNYIRVVCVGDCVLSAPDLGGPIIGIGDTASTVNDYIEWYADISQGHSWQIASCSLASGSCAAGTVRMINLGQDTSPVTCQGQEAPRFEGFIITSPNDPAGDNYSGIRIQGCDGARIRNNHVSGFRVSTGNTWNSHASCFVTYVTQNATYENNYCEDSGGGFSFKDQPTINLPNSGNIVRYNRVHNVGDAFAIINPSENALDDRSYFYQNVVTSFVRGVQITGARNDWIFNNTFYDAWSFGEIGITTHGLTLVPESNPGTVDDGAFGVRMWNNIIHTADFMLYNEATTGDQDAIDTEHNVYFGARTNFYGSEAEAAIASLAAWQSAHPTLDADNSPAGTISVSSDPLLADPANGDFRLCTAAGVPHASCSGASPAINRGVDLHDLDGDASTTDAINAGAYVTGNETIGLGATGGGGAGAAGGRTRLRIRIR